MGIQIGDNNRITNSVITDSNTMETKKNWAEKHPVLVSALISFVIGFILLFNFWGEIVLFLEGLF